MVGEGSRICQGQTNSFLLDPVYCLLHGSKTRTFLVLIGFKFLYASYIRPMPCGKVSEATIANFVEIVLSSMVADSLANSRIFSTVIDEDFLYFTRIHQLIKSSDIRKGPCIALIVEKILCRQLSSCASQDKPATMINMIFDRHQQSPVCSMAGNVYSTVVRMPGTISPSPGFSSRIDRNGQRGSQPTELFFHEIKIRSGCYKGRFPFDQETGTCSVQALNLAASQRN